MAGIKSQLSILDDVDVVSESHPNDGARAAVVFDSFYHAVMEAVWRRSRRMTNTTCVCIYEQYLRGYAIVRGLTSSRRTYQPER